MSWWSLLFGPRGPEPVSQVVDPVLGTLDYSSDDESWIGKYGGYSIAIGYSRLATPDPQLLAYAYEFLGENGATFTQNLAEARTANANEFQEWAKEYADLRVEMINFSISKRGMGCLVDLTGGKRDRSWRVEFDGMKCLGFGFDT